jgi:PREDICTED: similar to small GTPase, putative
MAFRAKFRDQIHDRIKVLVLGDSGVGKSCFVHLICKYNSWSKPSWTIGCSIEVILHEFNEGTPNHKTCLIELWDVGGYKGHSAARHLFYQSYHGIILIHDLTNCKSYLNLRKWLGEVLSASDLLNFKDHFTPSTEEFDIELFVGKNIPVLIVGTKKDLMGSEGNKPRVSTLAEECGALEIQINGLDPRCIAPATNNAVNLSRFFDKVIEKRYTLSDKIRRNRIDDRFK